MTDTPGINMSDLDAGRSYWIAWQAPAGHGTEVGCGRYLFTGHVNGNGQFQFNHDDGWTAPLWLTAEEVTSYADPSWPADLETEAPMAADVTGVLVSAGHEIALIYPNGDRDKGFYAADAVGQFGPVVEVYVEPPGDADILSDLIETLDAEGLVTAWQEPGGDQAPYLLTWRG